MTELPPLGGAYCDREGCSKRIEDRAAGYQIVRPDDRSVVDARIYCSVSCARAALERVERSADESESGQRSV